MHRIDTEIEIQAEPTRVWAILTDFAAYPDWNPFIRAADEKLEVGERLRVLIQPPGGRAMRFRPRVLTVDLERELRWKGSLGIPGLFDGEHSFVLEPSGSGVLLHHQETFSGLLIPLLRRSLVATEQGFLAMNDALKDRAEDLDR